MKTQKRNIFHCRNRVTAKGGGGDIFVPCGHGQFIKNIGWAKLFVVKYKLIFCFLCVRYRWEKYDNSSQITIFKSKL